MARDRDKTDGALSPKSGFAPKKVKKQSRRRPNPRGQVEVSRPDFRTQFFLDAERALKKAKLSPGHRTALKIIVRHRSMLWGLTEGCYNKQFILTNDAFQVALAYVYGLAQRREENISKNYLRRSIATEIRRFLGKERKRGVSEAANYIDYSEQSREKYDLRALAIDLIYNGEFWIPFSPNKSGKMFTGSIVSPTGRASNGQQAKWQADCYSGDSQDYEIIGGDSRYDYLPRAVFETEPQIDIYSVCESESESESEQDAKDAEAREVLALRESAYKDEREKRLRAIRAYGRSVHKREITRR